MVRSRLVTPDMHVPTLQELPDGTYGEGPLLPAVSRQAQLQAVVDAMTVVDVVGGMFTVVVERTPTGVPGERVTTKVLVEYKDRVDARQQAERDTAIVPPPAERSTEIASENGVAVAVGTDGEVVDEADVPEHLRGL